MSQYDKNKRPQEEKQASVLIQALCVVGLIFYAGYAMFNKTDPSLIVIALLGGGLLGVDNVLKFLKAIFRINGGS